MRLQVRSLGRMPVIAGVALALLLAASVVLPLASQVSSEVAYERSRGLAPATDPIATEATPWLMLVITVPLFIAIALLLSGSSRRVHKWMSVAAAGLKASLLGLLGIVAMIASTLPENQIDAVGLALLFISTLLIGPAAVYVAVVFASRASGIGWRVLAAIMDVSVSWAIAATLIFEGLNRSQPFWAGTARDPIYNYPPYGSWPLVWACGVGILWLALTMLVIVNAFPDRSAFSPNRMAPAPQSDQPSGFGPDTEGVTG
jgi:hypothetical protein